MYSDILAEIVDSACDGHVDCNDLITSITGSSYSFSSSFWHVQSHHLVDKYNHVYHDTHFFMSTFTFSLCVSFLFFLWCEL